MPHKPSVFENRYQLCRLCGYHRRGHELANGKCVNEQRCRANIRWRETDRALIRGTYRCNPCECGGVCEDCQP